MSRIPDDSECLRLLKDAGCSDEVVKHCESVRSLAMKIAALCGADLKLVSAGSLLHDIGRSRTHGIRHAVEGAIIGRELGLPEELVNIIERHIGAGLTRQDAIEVGLPAKDYIPLTLEEIVVAHADNLIATHRKQKVVELANKLREKGLNDAADRVLVMHRKLSGLCGKDLDEL